MKKIIVFLVLALILVSSLVISACGGDDNAETSTPVNTVTANPTQVVTKTPAQTQTSVATPTATGTSVQTPISTVTPISTSTSTSNKTLADIMGKGKDIGPVKYDQFVSTTGTTKTEQTTKVWMKGAWSDNIKMRYEMTQDGSTAIMLIDIAAKLYYTYLPDQNIALTVDPSLVPDNPIEDSEQINPTYVGKETIDGKDCSVYEWTKGGDHFKYWIWDKHTLPIKTEATVSGQTAISECKNIEFTNIDDSMFKLPDGVKIMTMDEFIKGMGDLFGE